MTYLENHMQDFPDADKKSVYRALCPPGTDQTFSYKCDCPKNISCEECWNREMSEDLQAKSTQPQILDSGNRRAFETGAVRDMQEGKGRCDLLPLDVITEWVDDNSILADIAMFMEYGKDCKLYDALDDFAEANKIEPTTLVLDLAKHFENGAKKYGERNWEKGIPVRCYIDSAVRHYLKYLRGDTDEPHDRAFVWNIVCAIWTCKHKPELNEYAREDEQND